MKSFTKKIAGAGFPSISSYSAGRKSSAISPTLLIVAADFFTIEPLDDAPIAFSSRSKVMSQCGTMNAERWKRIEEVHHSAIGFGTVPGGADARSIPHSFGNRRRRDGRGL